MRPKGTNIGTAKAEPGVQGAPGLLSGNACYDEYKTTYKTNTRKGGGGRRLFGVRKAKFASERRHG